MRRFLALWVVLMLSTAVFGYTTDDINYDTVSNPETLTRLLTDLFDNYQGTSLLFDPQTSAPAAAEGKVYYNDTANALYLYNGSAWIAVDTAGGSTLDEAYDMGGVGVGRTIDAGDGAVNITNTDADTAFLVTLNASPGSSAALGGMEITVGSNSTENGIEFENSGTGDDVQGTGDTWAVTKAGAATFTSIASVGDIQFTGSNYNTLFDASDEGFEFQDNATLNIGTGKDFVFSYDGTDFNLEAAAANDMFRFGETTHFDFVIHGETNTNEVTFDTDDSALSCTFDGFDLHMNDADILIFGDDTDISIAYDGASGDDLDITGSGKEIAFGADDEGMDLVWHTETTGDNVLFDESAVEVLFTDVDLQLDDDADLIIGSDDDWVIECDSAEKLEFIPSQATDDQVVAFGDADHTSDLLWYTKSSGSIITIDASADIMDFDGIDLRFDDGDFLKFGDDSDFTLDSSTTKILDVTPGAASDDYKVYFGLDQSGVDIKAFGATTGEYWSFDASADSVIANLGNVSYTTTDAEADQFKVDATGTVAGNAIVFETTNGGVQINADGEANGDISIDAADDMTLTAAGNLTLAVTGTVSGGGSALANVAAYVEEITAETDTLDAAESGKLVVGDYTGTQTITLPPAAAGLVFGFVDSSASGGDDLIIDCDGSDTIDGDGAGDGITSTTDAIGQSIWLVAIDGTQWITFNRSGTWGQQ